MKSTICLFLLLLVGAQGRQLVQMHPVDRRQVEALEVKKSEMKIDLLQFSPGGFEALVTDEESEGLRETLKQLGVSHEIANQDIDSDIETERKYHRNYKLNYDYDLYNDYLNIKKELTKLAAICIPNFRCRLDLIGVSIESRPIMRLKIVKAGPQRQSIWVDATTHAREWLTTATIMKIIKHMLTQYSRDPEVRRLLDTYDFHFVPVVNPDGYEYSWLNNETRLWRKNRRKNGNGPCDGVDLNRNADHAWGTSGASSNPCDTTYRGTSTASEPEVQAWQDAVMEDRKNLLQVVSIHARGQYWMTSYGNVDDLTDQCHKERDAAELLRVSNRAADAIERVYNSTWKRGPICSTMYVSSGCMVDFAKSKAGIRYTALPEVRGSSFIVPADQIEPSFREIYAGLMESIRAIEETVEV